jgi:hypothetical protein
MNSYPRESDEFEAVKITVDGVRVTAGVELTVTTGKDRPSDWVAPTLLGGKIGIMTGGRVPDIYRVWAKVTDSPETPVIDCGTFAIT